MNLKKDWAKFIDIVRRSQRIRCTEPLFHSPHERWAAGCAAGDSIAACVSLWWMRSARRAGNSSKPRRASYGATRRSLSQNSVLRKFWRVYTDFLFGMGFRGTCSAKLRESRRDYLKRAELKPAVGPCESSDESDSGSTGTCRAQLDDTLHTERL